MNILEFSITTVVKFAISILSFTPATDIGKDWKFSEEIFGRKGKDGLTAFKEVIIEAAKLPKEEGYNLLFKTGLPEGETVIIGEKKLEAFADENLADPDLLWSLYKEEGQKILRYLHDTYGITWMEALRRILLRSDGLRCSLYLCRLDVGSWLWDCTWLDDVRSARRVALVLGK